MECWFRPRVKWVGIPRQVCGGPFGGARSSRSSMSSLNDGTGTSQTSGDHDVPCGQCGSQLEPFNERSIMRTMHANVRHRYGTPDVLAYQEVAVPVPGDHDVLVQVHAAGEIQERGEPFTRFFASAIAAADSVDAQPFVLDVRLNGGRNGSYNRAIVARDR